VVSDFGRVDAIESGIVKIPRVPVMDTTGRPDPKYFRLWDHIMRSLGEGEAGTRRLKAKPEAVAREADDALKQLAGLWKRTFEKFDEADAVIPPAMIVVCNNTDLSEVMYERISGERLDDDPDRPGKKKVVFDRGAVFPELLQNHEQQAPEARPSMRIDTKLLNAAEGRADGSTRADVSEALRKRVNTVGKPGQPGEKVRCVVSVGMLTEGWDACNVTQILGLRAFTSQLLCEQVVGRGLRRTDYEIDPKTGLLTEEYVDVYGIPFEVIPFKKAHINRPPPPPKPTTWVHALAERADLELRFPRVEGIICDVTEGITVDWDDVEPMDIDQNVAPTETISRPRVGYQYGAPSIAGPGKIVKQTRQEFYNTVRLQEIEYELASRVTAALADAKRGKLRLSARHLLFPHVLGIVRRFRETRVNHHGANPKEIGVLHYVEVITQRLVTAIRPLDREGDVTLIPRLERYRSIGSTDEVDFHTTRNCRATARSHVSHVVLDTETWEASAAFYLESSNLVESYARNDHLDLVIPYEFLGQPQVYIPDFLIRLTTGVNLLLEVKGYETEEDREKHTAAHRWVAAVNNWGELGRWAFAVCHEPAALPAILGGVTNGTS
jgi:type III restriction enzyme